MGNVLLDIGLPIVLAFVMVGIGLTLTLADFEEQRKTPKALVVGVLGTMIVVPIIAFGIAIVFDLSPTLAIGLVLLGATAGGTTSNVLTYLAGGNTALSLVLTVLTNLATILSIPFWAGIALDRWGMFDENVNVAVSFLDVAALLVGLVLIPTSIGMFFRAKKPALAARLENTVSKVSGIVLFFIIIGATVTLDDAWTLLREAGPATLLLACFATATGVILGIITNLPRPGHIALGMEFGIKNITLTMLIALTALGSQEIALPAAVYGVMAYIPGLALFAFARRGYVPPPATARAGAPVTETGGPVMVGYDGSDDSLPALRWAAEEAMATQRELRVVLAWGLPTMGFGAVSASAELDRSAAEGALAEAVSLLNAEFPGLPVEGELVQDKPSQALLDRSTEAELLVVGHRSKGRVGRLILGSVASAVATHSSASVVVVRADADGQVRRVGPIVVGMDGSTGSEDAVRYAMDAAPRHGYQVVTVHAGSAGSTAGMSPALTAGRQEDPAIEVREVVSAESAAQLLISESEGAALVVVGSRGHGGFAGMLLGSVSRAVVDQASCSVAVIRRRND